MGEGALNLKGIAIFCDPAVDSLSRFALDQFSGRLSMVTGKKSYVTTGEPAGKGLCFVKDASVATEGYHISVTPTSAVVRASDFNGFL